MNKRFTDSEGRLWKLTDHKPRHGVLREVQVHRYLNEASGWMSERLMARLPEDVKAWKDDYLHTATPKDTL